MWNAIRTEIMGQKERLFLWVPVLFGAGIAAYFGWPVEPPWIWPAGAAITAMIVTAAIHARQHDGPGWKAGYYAAYAATIIAAGFASASAGTMRHGTPIIEKPMSMAKIEGTVQSVERLGGSEGSRVILGQMVIENLAPEDTPRKVRLKLRRSEEIEAGQRISAFAKIDAPPGPVAPGAYDFRRHFFFEGIGGVGFIYGRPSILHDAGEQSGAAITFERMRRAIENRINAQAGAIAEGIMAALITGQRGAIADEDNEAMRESGLYHLLSISGTHVCMVAGVLFFFSRLMMAAVPWIALRWPIKKIAAGVAIAGAAFYVALAGAEVPALRALMMTALVMTAILFDRSPFSLRLIAFAALVILAIVPHALTGVSFQMSFAAVAALICFFDWSRPWWMKWQARAGVLRKAVLYTLGILITSILAGTVTGLFSLYHFQTFSVYGILSNMLAVPLTGLIIMPAAIVALILMPLGMEAPALAVMEWGTMWMLSIAHWTAGLDGAVLRVRQWPVQTFFLISCGVIFILVWRGWRGKAAALCLLISGVIAGALYTPPDILLSGSGKLQAVRASDGMMYVSTARREKFTAENWMRMNGMDGEKPRTFRHPDSPVRCDSDGCRYEKGAARISFVTSPRGMREDCGWADLMIADIPMKKWRCDEGTILLDLFDIRDHGGYAAQVSDHAIRIRPVKDETAHRPWE